MKYFLSFLIRNFFFAINIPLFLLLILLIYISVLLLYPLIKMRNFLRCLGDFANKDLLLTASAHIISFGETAVIMLGEW